MTDNVLVPLLSGAYQARSIIAGAQRCVNLYPESNPRGSQTPVPITHYPTPGLVLLSPAPLVAPMRGAYRTTKGELFVVVGNSLYFVDVNWNFVKLGDVTNLLTPVSMSDNGLVMVLVDGSVNGYVVDLATHNFGQIIDPAFYGADKVDYLNTLFIFNRPGTPQFYISLPNADFAMLTGGTAFDPLDIAAKTGAADPIKTLIVVHAELWLVGELTSEVWVFSGAADFALQTMQGAFVDHGCIAKNSIAKQDLFGFWLSQDREGRCVIIKTVSYTAQRISTHAIESELQAYSRVDDAIGYCYQQEGHAFYVITFPTANKSWAYELATGQWHELAWTDANGNLNRHRANCCAFAYGKNVAGDWQNGQLYSLDPRVFTDNGNPITRIRSWPHLLNRGNRVFYNTFIAELQVGTLASNPNDPLISMRYSDDRGVTYSNYLTESLGAGGEYLKQIWWERLGMARDRIFEISWSSPIQTALNGAFISMDSSES